MSLFTVLEQHKLSVTITLKPYMNHDAVFLVRPSDSSYQLLSTIFMKHDVAFRKLLLK